MDKRADGRAEKIMPQPASLAWAGINTHVSWYHTRGHFITLVRRKEIAVTQNAQVMQSTNLGHMGGHMVGCVAQW